MVTSHPATRIQPAVGQIEIRKILLESDTLNNDSIHLIQRALAKGQASEVRTCYAELEERVASGNTTDRDALVYGIVSYILANHEDAIEYLQRLPKSGIACFYCAHAYMGLEQFEEAEAEFDKAEKNGYDVVLCKLIRAGCIRKRGQIDQAEALLRSVAREGATRAEYSYQMGCLLSDRGDTYGALEYFERAVDMDANHTRALFNLAQLNNQFGNDDDAIRLYEQMLSKPPIYIGALINLGLLYEDREQYGPAAFCFKRVLESQPDHEKARLYLKDIESTSSMIYDEDQLKQTKILEHVMQIPITDFELSARSRNCLERAGIRNLGDLTNVTEEQLLSGKNFGETSLREIQVILEAHSLQLGQSLMPARAQPAARLEELSPEERVIHEMMVNDLDLSVRARKCLARLQITTIGDLISRSADELLTVRNFGVTSLNEIREKLGERGIKLRAD
jgi:DNA-directed RNA polymerase subunit alpha